MSDTQHGPVRRLVEQAIDAEFTRRMAYGLDREKYDYMSLEQDAIRAAADAMDAERAREPDYNEVFDVPPLSRRDVILRVTNMGRGEPVWIDDDPPAEALDAQAQQLAAEYESCQRCVELAERRIAALEAVRDDLEFEVNRLREVISFMGEGIEYWIGIAAQTAWPQGDEAAEALARAMHNQYRAEYAESMTITEWDGLMDRKRDESIRFASAVLAKLAQGAGAP